MRNDILERKIARIIMAIADERGIPEDQALDLFYSTETYRQLVDPDTGLQLMSDGYIIEELRHQLRPDGRGTGDCREVVRAAGEGGEDEG